MYGPDSQNAPDASLETREPDDDDWSDASSVDTPTGILHEPVLTQEHDDHDGDQTVRRSTRTRIPVVGNRLSDLANEVLLATSVQDNDLAEDPKPSAPAQGEIFCESALFPFDLIPFEDDPLLAYGASNDPDVFYYHEAMREPDAAEFQKAMEEEIEGQWDNGNFRLFKRADVPTDKNILPGVWALRRKREILTNAVKKYKARWNLDGSKQEHGIDFDQTYSPTATWPSIRLLLTLTILNGWRTRQIDFVQAFPQAKISHRQFVELPKGIEIDGIDPTEWVFEVINNVYGGKDAGRQWYLHLKAKLEEIGFKKSLFDECLFYRGRVMYSLYTDDSILTAPTDEELDQAIEDMSNAGLELTVEGILEDFLGVNIKKLDDGSYELTQPRLIDSILEEVFGSDPLPSPKAIPMASSKVLSRHHGSPDYEGRYEMRRIVGKLNFLASSTRPDIAYATHQIARFVSAPKAEHGKAVEWLARYLLGTRKQGYLINPDDSKSVEIHVDADFAGNWDPELAGEDIDTSRSRHGFVISYAGVPVLWKSALQSEISLSTTEAEFIGLSVSLRTAIPIVNIVQEMLELGFPVNTSSRTIHCTIFEDNSGALEIARVPKARPRTKHMNNKYFHFMEYTTREEAPYHFEKIATEDQPADILTKPLAEALHEKHRRTIQGW
jgi:hypothetical protein